MRNQFEAVKDFEQALCEYTGAKYAVAVNSCTMALLLAVKGCMRWDESLITIPNRTYVSVPMSIIHAGCKVAFRDEDWDGYYQLSPLPVWDSARYFERDMMRKTFLPGDVVCVSFHNTKILGDTQGGAILHDTVRLDQYLRRMRFDGRTEGIAPKDDKFTEIGYHCYMSPDVATRLLWKLNGLRDDQTGMLPNDDYPDLSAMEIFK